MSDWKITGAITAGQAINVNSATQKAKIGTIVTAVDVASTDYGMGEFIYLKGSASTAVGSVVVYDSDGTTDLAVANDVGDVGLAMAATVASEFGWFQIQGLGVVKGLAGLATAKLCYLTATDGSVDDAVVAGDAISGMVTTSALDTPSSGLAEVSLNRPFVTNVSN
jgi:hypothetical protein|tara:strand:+ start:1103 stop:1600 length:498 start_codon:yes stop_codon:yes gene_type:complete